jgi:hypothetical protein
MRSLFFLFSLATLALGCGPGPNPALGDCRVRKEGAVLIGTGEDEFVPISSAGVRINSGNQGGEHIWLGLSCKNLGPRVVARFKITDVATGLEITPPGLSQVVELEYDGDSSDLGYGIFGYVEPVRPPPDESGSSSSTGGAGGGSTGTGGAAPMLPDDLTGRAIKIEADVSDNCKKPAVHAEVMTVISSG